ncbi:hypothetical protein KHP62_00510 [Rhodobacteraceae bacterium NNCM2]|nr:hypothetical protein [Coraliihabitans acroporae]
MYRPLPVPGALPLCLAALLSLGAAPAGAEPHMVPDCSAAHGLGVVTYAKTKGMEVSAVTELSEVCWDEEAAQLTAVESSRDLELTQKQGSTNFYQRLNGGTVSAVNEQLEVGIWEGRPDGQIPYFRWTTESSRGPAELNGFDFVTISGFLTGPSGYTPKPAAARYDAEMVLTGVSGALTSMAYGLFLPMQGEVSVEGDAFSITLSGFQTGMGPGEVALDMALTETDVGFDGQGDLTMENAMIAGAPPQAWKTITVRLNEFATLYSGDEMAFVGSFGGEMVTFDGSTAPVDFTFIGSGKQRD